MTDSRLLLVSNRLPVHGQPAEDGIRVVPSCGGLATGLGAWHRRSDGLWFGWPGDLTGSRPDQVASFEQELSHRGIVPVHLSRDQVSRYYDGFANRVLWPLFHYLTDRVPAGADGWDAYVDVNQRFADIVADHYAPGDIVWVHDYQLMLVPQLLRRRLPQARIGFFLHIPFPSSEVFRVLPWRREILAGLLGADVIGVHTFSYMRHLMTALLHVEGVEADVDRVYVDGRAVKVGVFPMGVDAGSFATLAQQRDVLSRVDELRRDADGRAIVLGVDRLDYTKGIPRRLEAIERLLERRPDLRDRLRYIQVAVPSRGEIGAYRQFRAEIEERVGRINGTYGTLRSLPVHYIHQAVSERDLVALYRAADVMLVTPLRDGMNLVAKEFAASRVDEDGVLVLSEFAGAAAELHGAITINPYDVDAVADTVARALTMPAQERRARMRGLRKSVLANDLSAWVGKFVDAMNVVRPPARSDGALPEPSLSAAVTAAQRRGSLRLLLDYDGTLVPLARSPQLATPDVELLELLDALAATSGVQVDIVSGRPPDMLEAWFGALPVSLWAEHGFWHRPEPGAEWEVAVSVVPDWMPRIRAILDQFVAATPGTHVEVKSASLAWHFRAAPREFGHRQAQELRMLLGDLLSNQPLEVLEGKKVIEVRFRGIGKGTVAQRVAAAVPADATIVAMGDDVTDEELFRALPAQALSAAVGPRRSVARFQLDDHRAVRRILRLVTLNAAAPEGAGRAMCAQLTA